MRLGQRKSLGCFSLLCAVKTAAAAKLLQSCLTLRPHRRQPMRLPRPWDSPGKNTGVGCHFLLQCRKVKSESEVTQLCPTLSDPMDCSPPGSSVRGIFQARVLEWGAIALEARDQLMFVISKILQNPFWGCLDTSGCCAAQNLIVEVSSFSWRVNGLGQYGKISKKRTLKSLGCLQIGMQENSLSSVFLPKRVIHDVFSAQSQVMSLNDFY